MSPLVAIILGGLAMSVVALSGLVTTVLPPRIFELIVIPLVALAAGSLIGGALFHMLPKSVDILGATPQTFGLVALGALAFLLLEQYLHWHHCHRSVRQHDRLHDENPGVVCGPTRYPGPGPAPAARPHPVGILVLVADGLHNFLGGLAVGAAFIIDIRVGLVAWLVAAAHEIPQELGDFGLLIHSGWPRSRALVFNVLSASTFLLGGLVAYAVSGGIDVAVLVPFAAGNFIYIAMADLVPQLTTDPGARAKTRHTLAFIAGLGLMYGAAFIGS